MIGRWRFGIVLTAVVAGFLSLSGCSASSSTYHQKMVLEVETPFGDRSAFSIMEVGSSAPPTLMKDFPGNGFTVRGEAVAVELAPGKTLFALLSPPPEKGVEAAWYQAMLFGDALRAGAPAQPAVTLPGDGYGLDAHEAIRQSGAKLTLPPSLYPLLVTFGDIRDPMSVKRVDPADLAASFGPGVRLRAITLEVVDGDITSGIEKRLNWLPSVYDLLQGQDFQPEGIPVGSFKKLFSTELPQ